MSEIRTGGNPIGHRNSQTKARNIHRKQFRLDHPEHKGKQLKKLPLENNYPCTCQE